MANLLLQILARDDLIEAVLDDLHWLAARRPKDEDATDREFLERLRHEARHAG